MPRRTKIVATLGPASSDPKTLARMIDAGLDVVRMNFSHGTAAEHTKRVELVRSLARKAGRAVGVLVDLQGPKIRIGRFRENRIVLAAGEKFVLDAECELGDQHRVGLDYRNLPRDVRPGDTLAAVAKYGIADKISYISTGGGAFLEFLEGKKLPAVEILEQRARKQD